MLNPTPETRSEPSRARAEGERTRTRAFRPNVDIIERPDAIELYADMPGVDESSTEITLERNVLTLKGQVSWQVPGTHRPVFREFEIGNYERVFTLSTDVDAERIQATVKHGVLHLVLPKAEPAKARRIAITTS